MAEGLLRQLSGHGIEVFSAGIDPGSVHPLAIRAMDEVGIDLRGHASKHVGEVLDLPFDYVITVCDAAAESCPVFPGGTQRVHWSFEDPSAVRGSEEERLAAFRRVRNGLQQRVVAFLQLAPIQERLAGTRSADARDSLNSDSGESGELYSGVEKQLL